MSIGQFHSSGPDTEREAARSVPVGKLRAEALALLRDAGWDGLTDDEGGALMGGDRLRFGRRRHELCLAGLACDSQRRRMTPSGRRAVVWIAP